MILSVRATEQRKAHLVNLCNQSAGTSFSLAWGSAPNCGLKKCHRIRSRAKYLGKGQPRGWDSRSCLGIAIQRQILSTSRVDWDFTPMFESTTYGRTRFILEIGMSSRRQAILKLGCAHIHLIDASTSTCGVFKKSSIITSDWNRFCYY